MGKKRMGAPIKEVDWDEVDKLMALQCTGEEIAGFIGMCYDTLTRAVKREHGMTYADYLSLKSQKGKVSLRKRQYDASKSSVPMMIHLGKQWLGQADSTNIAMSGEMDTRWTVEVVRPKGEKA